MYKLFFIARNNIKKQKGDMITFFILTLFAAFLIFDAASAILGTRNVLDDSFAAHNGAESGAWYERTTCQDRFVFKRL